MNKKTLHLIIKGVKDNGKLKALWIGFVYWSKVLAIKFIVVFHIFFNVEGDLLTYSDTMASQNNAFWK